MISIIVGIMHFPIDRFRLAIKYMPLTKQENFAMGGFYPWSIIVVDNVIHLITLWVLCIIFL